MINIGPSAAFNSGGMTNGTIPATFASHTGPTAGKEFINAVWTERRGFCGTTAIACTFAANT